MHIGNRTVYYNGYGYVVDIRRRRGKTIRTVGTARCGGNVFGTRERGEIQTLDLHIASFNR